MTRVPGRVYALAVVAGLVSSQAVLAAPAMAAESTYIGPDGIRYSFDEADPAAGAMVTGFTGTASELTIPGAITPAGGTTYEVTAIGESAFNSGEFTSVVIPDSVTAIEGLAFADNILTTVTLGSSVTAIGTGAFDRNDLTNVTIPASVTDVGEAAFADNPRLASVVFTGPAPAVVAGATGSFGPPGGPLVLSFPWRYGASQVGPGGFTTPSWEGYATQAVATVTFDRNGHGDTTVAQTVVGDAVAEPAAPTAEGWTFDGWFTSAAGGGAYDFSDPVASDLTLYAHWSAVPPQPADVPSGLAATGSDLGSWPGIAVAMLAAGLAGLVLAGRDRFRRGGVDAGRRALIFSRRRNPHAAP